MFTFSKQLTALALLTVNSIAGATLTTTKVLAQSNNGCGNVVKNIELVNSNRQRIFCTNGGNFQDISQLTRNAIAVGVQSGRWTFYSGKNFTGKSVTVSGETFQGLGFQGVGSIKRN